MRYLQCQTGKNDNNNDSSQNCIANLLQHDKKLVANLTLHKCALLSRGRWQMKCSSSRLEVIPHSMADMILTAPVAVEETDGE